MDGCFYQATSLTVALACVMNMLTFATHHHSRCPTCFRCSPQVVPSDKAMSVLETYLESTFERIHSMFVFVSWVVSLDVMISSAIHFPANGLISSSVILRRRESEAIVV